MATEAQTPPRVDIPAAPMARRVSRRQIFLALFACFLVMIAAVGGIYALTMHSWQETLRAEIERNLTEKARMFAADVNSDRSRNIATLTSQEGQLAGARATVVDTNGKVIADSEVRIADLDREGRTPEFAAALRGETGVDARARSAFGIPVLYVAVPVSGGAVRLAYPLSDLGIASGRAMHVFALAGALAVVAAFLVSLVASAQLSKSA